MTDKIFSFERAEDSSGFLLWQVTSLWQRGLKKELEKHNLTHAQYVLLASLLWLSRKKQSVMQIHLSTHSKIDPMTTSTVLRTLQSKGYIQRAEHDTDTRAKTIGLTDDGLKIVKKAIKTVEDFDRSFFSVVGAKQPDLNKMFLKIIQENIEA
jgi:MarR family transcriptional regulator, organic hydroperoxide resistance regulator